MMQMPLLQPDLLPRRAILRPNELKSFPDFRCFTSLALSVVLFHLSRSYHTDIGFSTNYFVIGAKGVDIFCFKGLYHHLYRAPRKGVVLFYETACGAYRAPLLAIDSRCWSGIAHAA
jgi:hypothetical protein